MPEALAGEEVARHRRTALLRNGPFGLAPPDFDSFAISGPILRRLPPELAHRLTIAALRAGAVPACRRPDDPVLSIRVFGRDFPNPLGLAAGFDKNAEVPDAMLALGFGFVEIGTVTPRPQPGNPLPRVFRLPEDAAMINRLGFNNEGLSAVLTRLRRRKVDAARGLVGANVGPNRESSDPAGEVSVAAAELAGVCDYLVVNVSSPNTPGLRDWQQGERLAGMIASVQSGCRAAGHATPILIKIAPDNTEAALQTIARVAIEGGVAGLIATNTTIDRPPHLRARHRHESGGLSGRPLFARSTGVLAALYRATGGRLPLIGVGGISSADDAYAKIRAGASLLQLYTALIYQGPSLVQRIKRGLAERLRRDGFASLGEAVGTGVAGPPTAETAP